MKLWQIRRRVSEAHKLIQKCLIFSRFEVASFMWTRWTTCTYSWSNLPVCRLSPERGCYWNTRAVCNWPQTNNMKALVKWYNKLWRDTLVAQMESPEFETDIISTLPCELQRECTDPDIINIPIRAQGWWAFMADYLKLKTIIWMTIVSLYTTESSPSCDSILYFPHGFARIVWSMKHVANNDRRHLTRGSICIT